MSYSLQTRDGDGRRQQDVREALDRAVWLTRHKKYLPAIELFDDELEYLDAPADHPDRLRFLSFHGLCVAMVLDDLDRAERVCRDAVERCEPEAGLYFNLGMVLLRRRRRREALCAFRDGLAIDPRHGDLRATLERLRPRRHPLFPFLERRHPLNKFSGLLRSRFYRLVGQPEEPVTDVSGEA